MYVLNGLTCCCARALSQLAESVDYGPPSLFDQFRPLHAHSCEYDNRVEYLMRMPPPSPSPLLPLLLPLLLLLCCVAILLLASLRY